VGSTYAPDFLGLMEVALINSWQAFSGTAPPGLFAFEELVMGKDGNLNREKRFPGTNKVGTASPHLISLLKHHALFLPSFCMLHSLSLDVC
jgi:acetyl-CoA carboxylase/biotin carboxylase 1